MPQYATMPRNFNSSTRNPTTVNNMDNLKGKQPNRQIVDPYGNIIQNSPVPPNDTLSMNSHKFGSSLNGSIYQQRASLNRKSKYNTLTPAEAEKINRFLSNRPTRTASVLHKPRPPPVDLAHLETSGNYQQQLINDGNTVGLPTNCDLAGRAVASCVRSYSINYGGSYQDGRRHSVNYGQNRGKLSRFPTIQRNNNNQRHSQLVKSSSISPNDSDSAMSFKSTLDVADSAYGSARLQTMSVDLGNVAASKLVDRTLTNENFDDNSIMGLSHAQSRLSDESYCSARSEQSTNGIANANDKFKGASKLSSSSTSKVFHNQLSSLKKFFRNMPLRKTFSVTSAVASDRKQPDNIYQNSQELAHQNDRFSESISQIFDRSLSPLSYEPEDYIPPMGEPRSMPFFGSSSNCSINYSNYDEFTKARNQQQKQSRNSHLSNNQRSDYQSSKANDQNNHHDNGRDSDRSEAWQLTSLPVSYERNLATVIEERQNSIGDGAITLNDFRIVPSSKLEINSNNLQALNIKPPDRFLDDKKSTNGGKSSNKNGYNSTSSSTNSSQSLTSNADSVLDYNRLSQAPVMTPFRFSFAQPSPTENNHVSSTPMTSVQPPSQSREPVSQQQQFPFNQRSSASPNTKNDADGQHIYSNLLSLSNLSQSLRSLKSTQGISQQISAPDTGLPPRIPSTGISSAICKQPDTSSGASSSNSSVLNGPNYSDQQSLSYQSNSLDSTDSASNIYNNSTGGRDNDADTTILSDTSTIQGDFNTPTYMNKCSELERTVASLKEKVVVKEKEITDLQLEQINSEYLIEQLKKTVSRLEKDNAYLKALLNGGGNNNSNRVDL